MNVPSSPALPSLYKGTNFGNWLSDAVEEARRAGDLPALTGDEIKRVASHRKRISTRKHKVQTAKDSTGGKPPEKPLDAKPEEYHRKRQRLSLQQRLQENPQGAKRRPRVTLKANTLQAIFHQLHLSSVDTDLGVSLLLYAILIMLY